MKHDFIITLFLLLIFVLSQAAGLLTLNYDAKVGSKTIEKDGQNITVNTVEHEDTALGERPETTGYGTILFLAIGILVGTLLVLLIIKIGKVQIWKVWFFLAVTLAITIALGVFLSTIPALIIAVILATWKTFKPNVFVHNISEILIYTGIAVLIVPMFKAVHGGGIFTHPVFIATVLLILISVYDIIAVWRSKHMVKMANFQTKSKVFAGLFIPYSSEKGKAKIHTAGHGSLKVPAPKGKPSSNAKNAILGGGDIAFPLIFTGVVMESLIVGGTSKISAFGFSLIITLTTTIALFLLLFFSKQGRFYPAMPFISAGCLAGYGIILLVLMF